jgi:low affinity Fe/Cu permease
MLVNVYESATTFYVNCFTVTVVHIIFIHLEVEVEKLPTKINYNTNWQCTVNTALCMILLIID